MAHFAEIDDNNLVLRVIVIDNSVCQDSNGEESESLGAEFCHRLFGGHWIQTSYHGRIRKNYAGIGYTYDHELDAFVPPQPYSSWYLDKETCQWMPPQPYPGGDLIYFWNELMQNWEPADDEPQP